MAFVGKSRSEHRMDGIFFGLELISYFYSDTRIRTLNIKSAFSLTFETQFNYISVSCNIIAQYPAKRANFRIGIWKF